jgi:hypothetical protein
VTPKTGHAGPNAEQRREMTRWMLDQKKERDPARVTLATFGLRHNRAHWVTIEQLIRYGARGFADAEIGSGARLTIRTENVRTLSLGPLNRPGEFDLMIDGRQAGRIVGQETKTFRRGADGAWEAAARPSPGEKRRLASGPIGDLFFDRTILTPGTAGTEEETYFNGWCPVDASGFYRGRNGGVHRGGIQGECSIQMPYVKDADLSAEEARDNNLILYGTYRTNSALARYEGKLLLTFEKDAIRVCGRTFEGKQAAVFAVFPHPENPERYVAVHGGVTPDAICWGSHLDMNLLPDYIAYSGGQLLGWGFWGNDWKTQPA